MQIVCGYARASFLAVLFVLTFVVLGQAQNTIRVPADFPSIQEALFSANNGDIILVSPGTYFESIFFQGKNVTVQSTDGPSVTIVDGLNSFTPVSFTNGEGPQATLRGFTITHGFAYQEGGGIHIENSSPTIENNVITANQACDGGGISALQSSAIIRHNIISNNTTTPCFPATGGAGVKIVGTGTVQLLNNTITGNQLSNSGNGGGIVTDSLATPLISGDLIQNNSSTTNGGGLSLASFAQVVDNVITGNVASGSGGGIYSMVSYGSPALVNNTAVANSAAQGPELYVDGSDSGLEIANNLFIDLSGTGAVFCGSSAGQIPTFDHNDIFSAAPTGAPFPAYAGACSDATGSNGNIQADPQFVDPLNGNYHLQLFSPAVDSGNNAVFNLPSTDLDGNIRVATSNIANCTGIVDMGAYEIVAVSSGTAVLSMSNLEFGTTFIGAPPAGPLLINLIGTQGCAQVASISASGDFQQTNNCNTLLPANSCTIQVTFSPTAAGLRTGSLKVQLSDGSAPITATLTGQGQNSASVFPSSLNFGLWPLQTSSFSQYVDIEGNPYFGPLQVTSISISGDFYQTNSCIASIGLNVCAVSVTFTPTVAGLRTGTLTIVSNQGVLSVPLSGFGAAAAPSLTPASLAFPTQLTGTFSPPQTVTLTNVGTADLQIVQFTVSSGYAAQPLTCGAVVPSGSSCTYSINFTPFVDGNTSGVFEVDTNAGPATVALSGSGVEPILNVSPQSLILDTAPIGGSSAAQTVTITNISGNPVQLTSIGAANNFLATSACPLLLDPNASCTIDVRLAPFTPGPYGGFLTVATTLFGNVTAALSVADTHRTLHVPADFASIGWAISNANNGDTVLVSPGTYNEQINFGGKAITVSSITGPGNTILDAQNSFVPVVFQNFEPAQAVLRGFTITNGLQNGIQISNASPTIDGNIISGTNSGPGITASSSAAVIQRNFIVNNNNQYVAGGQGGGGILVVGSNGQGKAQLLNNTIIGNQEMPLGGAGISVVSGGNALIQSNIIENNTTSGYGGGILINSNGTADIVQNLITGNSANIAGGIYDSSQGGGEMVLNNTVANNSAFSPGAAASITGFDGGVVFINNLLIDSTGLGAVDCGIGFWQTPAFLNNDVVSLVTGGAAYTGGCTDMTGISGNISQDPQFVNPGSNNYHVLGSSPAVDAGSLQAPTMPDHDLDGNPRVGPGNAQTCLSAIDLGVYELQLSNSGSVFLPANFDMGTEPIGGASTGAIGFFPSGCLQISSVKTTGDFQQANSCTGAISSSSGGCSIQITFTPTLAGAESGTLVVDFGPTGPAQTMNLFGTGFVATVNTSLESLDFGSQTVQTSSAAQGVNILANDFGPSTPALQINGIWVNGDFSQTNNCGLPLASGSSCSFAVVFTPTATGQRTGSLVVSTNVGLATVFLSGNGVAQ